MKKITIIGAGIGGLTTAIALRKKGFEVEIFENSSSFKKAGSGINLAINAMQVFKRLGVYDDIFRKANYTHIMCARDEQLNPLTTVNMKSFEEKYGVKTVAIHRADLHEILVEHIGETPIYLNKKLERLEQSKDKVQLFFEDGTTHEADVVIGADGIHSKVRNSVFPTSEIRDAQQVCWRGIAKMQIGEQHRVELNEIWGRGHRFGFVPISQDEVYWFGLISKNRFTGKDMDLTRIFSDFDALVTKIIAATPKDELLCNEIWDLKPLQKWYDGNVCLLGDAAHATTPNMGQGACQAVESAMALSICMSEESHPEKAFARYQEMRLAKANSVIKSSWMLGKIAQTDSIILAYVRNLLAKVTPKSVSRKQSEKMFNLNF